MASEISLILTSTLVSSELSLEIVLAISRVNLASKMPSVSVHTSTITDRVASKTSVGVQFSVNIFLADRVGCYKYFISNSPFRLSLKHP